jgi:ATP adenylyltransferase
MDLLWTPWRYQYVTTAGKALRPGVPASLSAWTGDLGCVFCNMLAAVEHAIATGMPVDEAERAAGLVVRGTDCFVCLNAFPYTSGHVMVIPYKHEASFAALPASTAHELTDLAQKTERVLKALYSPHGINFGMNLGQAAGAGVAGHLHLHGLPRWIGDTNFMTTVAETRILPEGLDITWERMRAAYEQTDPNGEAKRGPAPKTEQTTDQS